MELKMKKSSIAILTLLLPAFVVAQNSVSGTVTDKNSGQPLVGVNVVVEGTAMGAATGADGSYSVSDVPDGSYTVTATYIGYSDQSMSVNVSGSSVTANFSLAVSALGLSQVDVVSSRSDERAPVAFTTITKSEMQLRLASRDIPMALETVPGVYASEQGGGAGDSRITVRGFTARNVGTLINGVPVSDMENGKLYWSNWDGLGDAAASIQLQKGMSDVNVAVPALGGTINIVTDPSSGTRGGYFKQELGSWGFQKSTFGFNTGLMMDGKFSMNGTVVQKSGDGYFQGTKSQGYAYYVGMGYQANDQHRVEAYLMGAPQRHGHNLYEVNAAIADGKFAEEVLGFDKYAMDYFKTKDDYNSGVTYNQTFVSDDGKKVNQYFKLYSENNNMESFTPGGVHHRENFFHKPLGSINHYFKMNDAMRLSTVAYWSGGRGGGAGDYGSPKWSYHVGKKQFHRTFEYGASWAENTAANRVDSNYHPTKKRSDGILRSSMNEQDQYGLLSKLDYKLNDDLALQFGADWRTATIGHYRAIRDLIGGDYFVDYGNNEFNTTKESQMLGLGDKVLYHNTNTVDWIGGFGSARYDTDQMTAFGVFGWTSSSFTVTDHFTKYNSAVHKSSWQSSGDGGALMLTNNGLTGTQLKMGARYFMSSDMSVFANFGSINKVPILDQAIDDEDYAIMESPVQENFTSLEVGTRASLMNNQMTVNAVWYNSTWNDRQARKYAQNAEGQSIVAQLEGLDQLHTGIELEVAYQPMPMMRVDAALGIGNWTYTSDVKAKYEDYDGGSRQTKEATLYIKDLHVGDSPQTQMVVGVTAFPMAGLTTRFLMKHNAELYADFDPTTREDSNDRTESWKLPDFTTFDLYASYKMNAGGYPLSLNLSVLNLTDLLYVNEAVDNSKYGGYHKDANGNTKASKDRHTAQDAAVYFGMPMRMNLGVTVSF